MSRSKGPFEVAAYNWPGGSADLAYLLARRGVVELHISTFILGEMDRVPKEEFGWEEERAERAVAQIRRVAGEEYTNPGVREHGRGRSA